MGQDSRQNDQAEIERLREQLVVHLNALDNMRPTISADTFAPQDGLPSVDPAAFDNLDTDAPVGAAVNSVADAVPGLSFGVSAAGPEPAILPPECRRLSMPSTWQSTDNVYRAVELKLRMSQADKTLQLLRDTIADKSFQYSHVIRVAPRKGVLTRARAAINKMNGLITYYSRVYGQCRAAMLRLGADDNLLDKYRILQKDDVKSSTAILNPNEPGSTRMKLSWIWKTLPGGDESQPDILRECE